MLVKKQRLALERAQQIKNTESAHNRKVVNRDGGFGSGNKSTIHIIGLHSMGS
jgi:hypothetical protein